MKKKSVAKNSQSFTARYPLSAVPAIDINQKTARKASVIVMASGSSKFENKRKKLIPI